MFLLLAFPTKRPMRCTKFLPTKTYIREFITKKINESYKFNILKLKLWENHISTKDLKK
jgi:hypothetical protein